MGVYEMKHDAVVLVKQLVDYFYTSDYCDKLSVKDTEKMDDISDLDYHTRMFGLADKYDIPALKALSARKFGQLALKCSFPEFLDSICDVYDHISPARNLRDVAVQIARFRLPQNWQTREIKEQYDELASDVPDFTKELLDVSLKELSTHTICDRCSGSLRVQTVCSLCEMECDHARSAPEF